MIWVANFKFSSIELKLEGQSIAKKYMSSSITENSDVHTLKKEVNIFVYVLAIHMASTYT